MSLFQTHAWQSAWWEVWGRENNFDLVREWGDGRSGLYLSRYRIKGLIPATSLEFVGCSYRNLRSTRTEYNSFRKDSESVGLSAAALKSLLTTRWSEAVFNDLIEDSEDTVALRTLARQEGWLVRETAADAAWHVNTDGLFRTYLKSLGSNTRLRLYNRRSVLETTGAISTENCFAGCTDPGAFFRRLNEFHRRRWGKPVYGDKALAFNTLFLQRVQQEGGEPQLSLLKCNDGVISVLYNVKYQGCVYNLQSGFEETFHPKLALGTLHLGYAIEEAFNDPEVSRFDMLAGSGKKENYKARIATGSCQLVSLMVVRNPLLKVLYRLKDSKAN
ncbi:GNAT family N-acetyltransferase [Marinobacter salicampi]|uniref:GNAT family N-acetyltransferase n=1 Tax=Marinobacter salicampi TaxID=435907 RepID=UPI00140AC25D|nr:GNAT family N-acetyltransferase [Marinobacter salicampi]